MTEGSLRAMVDRGIDRKIRSGEPKLEEEAEYQAFSFGRVGPRPQIMLEICKSDGYRLVLPYIDLKKITTMNPDNGFELHYSDQKVVVEGRNLKECYRYIKQNRLDSMLEAERSSAMAVVQQEAVISSLKIANAASKKGENSH